MPHMVSESVGTVMCVKLRWHAGFHSNVFMKVLEWRKWGRVDGDGVVCLDVDTFGDGFGMRLSSSCEVLSCWGGSISMSSI